MSQPPYPGDPNSPPPAQRGPFADGLEAPTLLEPVRTIELARQDVPLGPPPGAPPAPPKKRSNSLYIYGAAVVLAIAAAVGIAIALGGGDDDNPATPPADTTAAAPAPGADDYTVVAKDIAFNKASLLAPPDTQVSFTLKNDDSARHSLQFLDERGGKELAAGSTGKIIAGGASDVVTFKTPGAGTYYFECAVHPGAMNGSFEAKVGAPPPPQVAAPPAAAPQPTTIDVTATEFKFDKASIEVDSGANVTVNLKNGGQARHSIQFLDAKGGKELAAGSTGKIITAGQTDTFTFIAPAQGSYYFECAVHPGQMNGVLTARAGGAAPAVAPTTFAVVATNFKFDKPSFDAPAGQKLTFNLKNDGAARHSIQFLDAKGGKELAAGATGKIITTGLGDVVTFTPPGAGSFYFECAVHPGQMNGTLKVGGGAPPPVNLNVVATNFKFDMPTVASPAGAKLTINLKNDGPARHSIQFLDVKGGKELTSGATGKIITAGQSDVVTFTAPGAGTYYFECAVHPAQMSGAFVVGGGGTPPPATFAVASSNFRFNPAGFDAVAGSRLTFNLKNDGAARHSIQFLDKKGGKELAPGATGTIIAAGATDVVTFTAPAAGAYYFECAVHPAQMFGALNIRAIGAPAPLPSVTAPAAVSRLQSGAKVQVILATNLYQDPSGSARVIQPLRVGDRLTVVTGTPAASTVVTTEGLIFWRVLVDGTQTVGWAPEVTSDGSRRFLDLVR